MARIKARLGILLVAIAGVGVFAFACFDGLWIPNKPNANDYPVRGVDVSHHQGTVDWNAVAAGEVRFVYLKATEGGDFQDASFAENLAAARKAGLECGAYHYFSLKAPGLLQAQNFIRTVPRGACSLPCAVDLEYTGNSSERPSAAEFQRQLDAFLTAIRAEYGSEPVFYVDDALARDYLGGYPIQRRWVRAVVLGPSSNWMFWQFTELGKVPGIHGFVDLDVFHGTAAAFDALIRAR